MQALHLPQLESPSSKPLFTFPSNPATSSDLIYSKSYPLPAFEQHSNPHHYPYRKLYQAQDSKILYLIKVHSTALTKGELSWIEVLLPSRFTTDRGPIPGHDVVGVIDKVYNTTEQQPKFKTGDLVWGLIDFEYDGAAAEYVIARESEISLAPTVAKGEDEGLATMPLSALTAWQALFEYGGIAEPGRKEMSTTEPANLLITGSSGSVGVFAVQLAALSSQPVKITAIASKLNAQFVKELGADDIVVYDSTEPLLAQIPTKIDLLLDLTGPSNDSTLRSILQSSDINIQKLVSVAEPLNFSSVAGLTSEKQKALQTQTKADFFIVRPQADQLDKIGGLCEQKLLRGFVDEMFPLENGRKAMKYVECRQRTKEDGSGSLNRPRRGKVVLKV